MPEIVVTSVEIEEVKGRVSFAPDRFADVTVFVDGDEITATVDVPSGDVVDVQVPVQPDATASVMLEAAARAAMADQEA